MAARVLAIVARIFLAVACLFLMVSVVIVLLRPELHRPYDPRWQRHLARPLPWIAFALGLVLLSRGPGAHGAGAPGAARRRGANPVARVLAGALVAWSLTAALVGWLDLRIDGGGYDVTGAASIAGAPEVL